MKKILSLILVCAMLVCSVALFASCDTEKIIVHTNAFFAPFEYYEGTEIKGVDVEIMNLVGKKLGKKIGTQTDTTGWIYTDGESMQPRTMTTATTVFFTERVPSLRTTITHSSRQMQSPQMRLTS